MSNSPEPDLLTVELYKSLRAELSACMEKIPGIWLQKFVLTGTVIAFLASTNTRALNQGSLLTASIAAIPVLAILLDVKVVEYALHARAISLFIREQFGTETLAGAWEAVLWGDNAWDAVGRLVRLRSMTTVVVTAVPTVGVILLAGVAIDRLGSTRAPATELAAATGVCYLVAVWISFRRVWPSERAHKRHTSRESSPPTSP